MTSAKDSCRELRIALLDLHRTLIGLERAAYEKAHGPQSAGEFLQVVAFSSEMRWLEPLSRLIVMLDEAVDQDGVTPLTPPVVAARLRELLTLARTDDGSFSAHYTAHFDASPELAHQHLQLLALIKQTSTSMHA